MPRNVPLLLCTLTLLAGCAGRPPVDTTQLLVGCAGAACPGIQRFAFDGAQGRLTERPLQTLPSANPSWLVLSADGSQLFATNENPPRGRDPAGQVSSFAIGAGAERSLTPLSQVATRGAEPTHASLSEDGRFLFVAHYGTRPTPGGSLAVIPVTAHGTLGAVAQQVRQSFSRRGSQRQGSSHMHAAVPVGGYLFVTDLGADKVYAYRYDGDEPKKPLQAARPGAFALPKGSGPRHLAFDRSGTRAYLSLELSNQIAILGRDEARLEQQGLVDLDPPGANAEGDRRLGAIHLSPDGRFLYVARRGVENQIVVYAVSPADGSLSEVQRHASGGEEPREFTFAPDGRFLLVANQKSDSVAVFSRDPQSGLLVEQVQGISTPAPSALRFVP
ncbi:MULTISPECIES: lactonase family protein [unclassified Pseudomonas]|uniref:lactonase family protein n=1 Tax=unclassified Pseudomonas TaxID=196821 RepID=UPI000DAA706B|nr:MULTISPECIES: lactonase family protein [unclassified Pseudomonas]MDW3715783.1 lactonase family protein [Pseudomonas sp. 2023EL-01195]PZE09802.1 3-carboxymuconate cyclase [Pseudomonas sp. 57B-090624]